MKNKIALITGASSGIGRACAELLAESQYHLILMARRVDVLNTIADELTQKYSIKVLPLQMDIRNKQQIHETIAALSDEWKDIDILINNAGVGVTTKLMQDAETDDWDTIIDTNIKGLLYVTRAVLPIMIKRNSGHVINIGSAVAHAHYRGGNVYSASKHAVHALTQSLRYDLKGHAIRVTEIDPGIVATEFSKTRWGAEKAEKFNSGFDPLVASDIAESMLFAVTRPARVNVAEILVYPTAQVGPADVYRAGDKLTSLFD